MLWLCFLAVISLPGAVPQIDIHRKVFVLPKWSDNSLVTLTAQVERPLTAFTVCLRFYAEVTHTVSLLSSCTKEQRDHILLLRHRDGRYLVSVGGEQVVFRSPLHFPAPEHVCASWDSASGITELWVDGKPMVRKSLKKGHTIGARTSIVLGKWQPSLGSMFGMGQPLLGDIGDVNMWDSVLSPEEIRAVYAGRTISPNVLDWRALNYEAHGEVFA